MNNYVFPGDLQIRPVALSDLAADNQAIGAIYTFAKTIDYYFLYMKALLTIATI